MPRTPKTNEVPIAPFNLRETGPLLLTDAFERLGKRWYVFATGAAAEPNATIDRDPCPDCKALNTASPVEWAATVKYGPTFKTNPKDLARYVYARCSRFPKSHRWGFRGPVADKPAAVIPSKPVTPIDPETSKPTAPPRVTPPTLTPEPEMTAIPSNPFAAIDPYVKALIESEVGERVKALEEVVTKPQPTPLDEGRVTEIAKGLIAELATGFTNVRITVASMPEVLFEGRAHPALKEILELIAAGERFFMLVGPAASGKSTLARQVAEALKRSYCAFAVTQTVQREDILGVRAHNLTAGTVSYKGTAIVETWEANGVICLDEMDRGDANTLCCLNSIEQGALYVPRTAEEGGPLARSDKAIIIGTANTFGTGANRVYVGANQLDAAYLDRWYTIEVGYDAAVEHAVCGGDEVAQQTVTAIEAARTRANAASVRRPLTTRMARRAALLMRLKKVFTPIEGMRRVARSAGWTATEVTTVFP
jgi:energy-coupling factor transporter ATP-binding protein EcfA2